MKVWIIMTGETLPLGNERPHRAGILARRLANNGHAVTWWASTFDHQQKAYTPLRSEGVIDLCQGCRIHLIHSKISYKKNISISRILNHRIVAKNFLKAANKVERPDIIFCCFPTIELSEASVNFAKKNNIPVIIDVRDLWPDIFISPFPSTIHPLIKLFLLPLHRTVRHIFDNCTAITAISKKYLNWATNFRVRGESVKTGIFPLSYDHSSAPVSGNQLTTSELLQTLGVPQGRVVIWFVGTFGNTYDLGVPIEAAKYYEKNFPEVLFVFSGDGERGQEWRNQAVGLTNVIFTGWVDQNNLRALAGITNLGLMAYAPGAPQGLPNKVFEFMAGGIPILSSLPGETRELLELHQIGRSYRAGDTSDFIQKLNVILEDKNALEAMAQRSKATFVKHFSPDMVYSSLIEFIEQTALHYKN